MRQLILPILAAAMLTACATAPDEFSNGDPLKARTPAEQAMVSARNAALESVNADIKRGELSSAEKTYRAAPGNAQGALSYAKLLRKVNMAEQADMILKPFVINPKTATNEIFLEYAKLKAQLGDFKAAQALAEEAMMISDTARSRMVLGIAVDAQGHHQAAENHFRAGLVKVGMDMDLKNSLLNNLALSLIGQDKMSAARQVLSEIQPSQSHLRQGTVNQNKKLAEKL